MIRPFDPVRALSVLIDHQVDFVLIGGIAARIHGSPTLTNDLDLCYSRTEENLIKLARAMRLLNASLRGAPEDVPFIMDAGTLERGDHFTLNTDAGALDLIGTPAGSGGFDELIRTAVRVDLDGLEVWVVQLDALIRMKLAAGRPKDRIEAEVLGALQEEIDQRDRKD